MVHGMRKRFAGVALVVGIVLGGGAAVDVAPAAAAPHRTTVAAKKPLIRPGHYTFQLMVYGFVPAPYLDAMVKGNHITVYAWNGPQRSRIHPTRHGAFFDYQGYRLFVQKTSARGYTLRTQIGGIVIGHTYLRQKR